MKVKRGDLYIANLDPVIGHEQGGIRPVLVIQNNNRNDYSSIIVVAPINSREKKYKPLLTHYYISDRLKMPLKSYVALDQIKAIDKERLIKKIGELTEREMLCVDHRLIKTLNLQVYIKKYIKQSMNKDF